MNITEVNRIATGIQENRMKARDKEALNLLTRFGDMIGDRDLNDEILNLNARFSDYFKAIRMGTQSDRNELNELRLSFSGIFKELEELAEKQLGSNLTIGNRDNVVEKIAIGSNRFHKALKGLMLARKNQKRVDKDKLIQAISRMEKEISNSEGRRILWIDDNPHVILEERRLLRALGLEIVMVNNREKVFEVIEQDGDFDLLVSDIQWLDEQENVFYGGFELIQEIKRKYRDSFIGQLNTIFYTGYAPHQIETIDRQTGIRGLENSSIIHSFDELVEEIFSTLYNSKYYVGDLDRKDPDKKIKT